MNRNLVLNGGCVKLLLSPQKPDAMASGTFTGQKSWCNDFILLKWKLTDNSLLTLDRVHYNTRLYCQHQVYTFMLPVWESLINMNMKRHTSTHTYIHK